MQKKFKLRFRALRDTLGKTFPVIDESIQMYRRLGYFPRLRDPRSFNEKIGHRKLFGYDPRFAELADKWRVRDYVRKKVGKEHLVKVWQYVTDPKDLNFDALPDSFVVKGTHDWRSTMLVDDKFSLEWERLIEHCETTLNNVFGLGTREYWYREIPPGVIIEERLRDDEHDVPLDYKFFVFHGTVRFIQVVHDRVDGARFRFYTDSWEVLDVSHGVAKLAPIVKCPPKLSLMKEIAQVLADGFDFVRVDLYNPNGDRVLFGELTFSPAAGRKPFFPRDFDFELGSYW